MSSARALAGALLALAVIALPGCSAQRTEIVVSPADGPFEQLDVTVTGLAPGAGVTLTSSAYVDDMRYGAEATFVADASGNVDLSTTAPTGGSWVTADPMAPFWSLTATSPSSPTVFDEPYTVELSVRDESDATLARVEVARPGTAPAIDVRAVEDAGFLGAFAIPAESAGAPRPAALVLGGSEGGLESATMAARWIASLGYPALAVAYFDEPGLPAELENVPVEPVLAALEWLHVQPEVAGDALFTFGVSRGGELALWLAAEHPDLVAGAFAPVGSGFLVCGYPNPGVPAWTLGQQPLSPACASETNQTPPAARVDVAAIDGPVVLACGGKDEIWPSCYFMRDIVDRRGSAPTIAVERAGASHHVAIPPGVPGLYPGVPVLVNSATHEVRAEFWTAVAQVLGSAAE